MLEKKRQAWQETMEMARYKSECLESILGNLRESQEANNMKEMTDDQRAWLLVKMVCIEDIRTQKALSEALWL